MKSLLLVGLFTSLGAIYQIYLINSELKAGQKKIEEYWNLNRRILGRILLLKLKKRSVSNV